MAVHLVRRQERINSTDSCAKKVDSLGYPTEIEVLDRAEKAKVFWLLQAAMSDSKFVVLISED